MELTKIVDRINDRLAGELLTYDQMKYLLDAVIDDINMKLNAKYPVFTDFNNTVYTSIYPNYNFFPDKYIRTVVVPGVAHKFYNVDEEGILADPELKVEYLSGLFIMERDYADQVPAAYQETGQGYLTAPSETTDSDENIFTLATDDNYYNNASNFIL